MHYTFSLFFSRSKASEKIARALFRKKKLDVRFCDNIYDETELMPHSKLRRLRDGIRDRTILIQRWASDSEQFERTRSLNRFPYFHRHLHILRNEMNEWKPNRKWDFRIPGYRDRFAWYTTWFGLIISFTQFFIVAFMIAGVVIDKYSLDEVRKANEAK